jgi:hypothetical protein
MLSCTLEFDRSMPLQNVHIRINDAATGQPTPVRLRVTDANGNYFAPFGHAAEFPTGRGEAVGGDVVVNGKRWAYIDGSCEIAVPPGELTIEATKGPEFRPLRETITLPLGKMSLRFSIERLTNLQAGGWYSGDTRAHVLSPHAALLEAAAEDLVTVHLLAGATPMLAADEQSYVTYPNLEAFSGQSPALEHEGRQVIVGTHNKHPILGELALLHSHRVVYPLSFGDADATDDWSLGDWSDQCHRKRGLVVWTNAAPLPVGHAAEALAHAILGHVDALELSPERPEALQLWYQLLNVGCRMPLIGASAKRSNAVALGSHRTYAKLCDGEPINSVNWIEALREGRTVFSAGAWIEFTVDGVEPGAGVVKAAGDVMRCTAGSAGCDSLELLWNGQVAASGANTIEQEFACVSSGWLAARAWSPNRKNLLAHTSPIWVQVADCPQPRSAGIVAALGRHLEAGREWVKREGRFEQPRFRSQLVGTFDAALEKLGQ